MGARRGEGSDVGGRLLGAVGLAVWLAHVSSAVGLRVGEVVGGRQVEA